MFGPMWFQGVLILSKGQQIARRVIDLAVSLGSGWPQGQGKYLSVLFLARKATKISNSRVACFGRILLVKVNTERTDKAELTMG